LKEVFNDIEFLAFLGLTFEELDRVNLFKPPLSLKIIEYYKLNKEDFEEN